MPKGQLEHANITVTDPERSAALLKQLCGWRERWRGPSQLGGWTIHVGDETTYLAIYTNEKAKGGFAKGVPLNHVGLLVDDLESVDVRAMGAALRYHEAFAPKGTNANFQQVEQPGGIAIRTYERGVEDETLACGTGIVANALVHHLLTGTPPPIRVRVRGGDQLEVGFTTREPGTFTEVTLTGPADFVFTGTTTL